MKSYFELLEINKHSLTPKYKQLAEAIVQGMKTGKIVKNDILPSLHEFCVVLDISKNSVEKAYNTLKKQGIVKSVPGKGHFATNYSSFSFEEN